MTEIGQTAIEQTAIEQTAAFAAWFGDLVDRRTRIAVLIALDRLALGGGAEPAADAVHVTPAGDAARLYLARDGGRTVVLVAGTDPRTRGQDLRTAQKLARGLDCGPVLPFDGATALRTPADVAAYLTAAFGAADPALAERALDTVARCPGLGGAELSPDHQRTLASAAALVQALGLRLAVTGG